MGASNVDYLSDTLGRLIQAYLEGNEEVKLKDIIDYVCSTEVRELIHGNGEGGYR